MKKAMVLLDGNLNVKSINIFEIHEDDGEKQYYECQQNLFKANVIVKDKKEMCVGLFYYNSDGSKLEGAPIIMGKSDEFMPAGIINALEEAGEIVCEDIFLARMLFIECEDGDVIPPEYYELVANIYASKYLNGKE